MDVAMHEGREVAVPAVGMQRAYAGDFREIIQAMNLEQHDRDAMRNGHNRADSWRSDCTVELLEFEK